MTKQPSTEQGLGVKLARTAQRALSSAGITRLEQLYALSENDLNAMHGIGPNALNALRVALKARGMSFAKGGAAQRTSKSANKKQN